MAVTKTPRLNQTRWSSGQDSVARTDFDTDAASLESNAMIFKEGTLAARPPAGVSGRFYTVKGDATSVNNGRQFYDNGLNWEAGSTYSNRLLVESNSTETAPTALVKAGTSETYESFRVEDNLGNRMLGVNPNKTINIGTSAFASQQAVATSIGLNVVAPSATQVAIAAQGVVGQSEPVFSVRHSGGGANLTISVGGTITTGGNISAAAITGTSLSGGSVSATTSASLINTTITSASTGTVPLTINGLAGQTNNLTVWNIAGVGYSRLNREGDLLTNRRVHVGLNGSGTDLVTGTPQFVVKNVVGSALPSARVVGHDSQNGNAFEVTASNQTTKWFSVSSSGSATISGTGFVGGALSANGATLDPLYINGATPPLEVLTGTATGTFTDRIVLRHSQTSTAAVARSTGILMSLGNEATSGNAFKSAAVYVQSNAAASDSPTLRFNVGSANVMTLDTDSLVNINGRLYVNGTDSATIHNVRLGGGLGSKISLYQSPEYDMGVQPGVYYQRGDNFAWYKRGTTSLTAWDSGAGGSTLMTLTSDSDNRLTVGRLTLNDSTPVTSASPILRLGSSAQHMQFSNLSISTFTSNANTTQDGLYLQAGTGGELQLGSGTTEVKVPSRVLWFGSNVMYIGGGDWGSAVGYSLRAPIDNDIWIDTTRNGMYIRMTSSWATIGGPPA